MHDTVLFLKGKSHVADGQNQWLGNWFSGKTGWARHVRVHHRLTSFRLVQDLVTRMPNAANFSWESGLAADLEAGTLSGIEGGI